MLGSRVFVFHVESMRIVLGASAPGLGWESVLVQAIRRYYADAVQGRWVTVLASTRVEKNRRFERWSVLTSRDEVLNVVIRERTTVTLEESGLPEEEIDDDPPELKLALEYQYSARAIVQQAKAETWLREVAGA